MSTKSHGSASRREFLQTAGRVTAASALAAWERLDTVLGVGAPAEVEVPAEIQALLEARQAARQTKDFQRADALRHQLKAKGWISEDTPKGVRVKKM